MLYLFSHIVAECNCQCCKFMQCLCDIIVNAKYRTDVHKVTINDISEKLVLSKLIYQF